MNKLIVALCLITTSMTVSAQYGEIIARLCLLEQKKGLNQELKNENIDHKKFVLIKNFDDHTERLFISINGNQATYAEVFDDKKDGESSSNVFTGDVVRTEANLLSFRFDRLEGSKLALPLTKNLLLTRQKNILYLMDITTKERWIEESALKPKRK
ncbi:hypothetical protein [Bergeyella sp. RCAD1439]|uniref:hypothetical protein n=1 Tax=Bergeyella anatis TaxID=3113737 RepID=UPI002E199DD2|nr:hypothetical protein [Bergeyella sp. RCAD1439]